MRLTGRRLFQLTPYLSQLIVLLPAYIQAQPIYIRKDAAGNTVYSSSPGNSTATPADLPPLERENLSQKIADLRAQTPPNCISHGGVDCSRGPDADGSVICQDDYRGAILPFRFSCLEARLSTKGLTLVDASGVPVSEKNTAKVTTLQLTIRNNSDVEAKGMKVSFLIPTFEKIYAFGPEMVEPYGLAEYILHLDELPRRYDPRVVPQSKYEISCTNCGSVVRR